MKGTGGEGPELLLGQFPFQDVTGKEFERHLPSLQAGPRLQSPAPRGSGSSDLWGWPPSSLRPILTGLVGSDKVSDTWLLLEAVLNRQGRTLALSSLGCLQKRILIQPPGVSVGGHPREPGQGRDRDTGWEEAPEWHITKQATPGAAATQCH